MVNFWENDKNISPPYALWKKCGGRWIYDVGEDLGKTTI
jgi:hypothetical protein